MTGQVTSGHSKMFCQIHSFEFRQVQIGDYNKKRNELDCAQVAKIVRWCRIAGTFISRLLISGASDR
jgi:hypothetical protein